MGKITSDQSQSVMAILMQNTRWSEINFDTCGLQDGIVCNPIEAGRQFEIFLKNGGRVRINRTVNAQSKIIPIQSVQDYGKYTYLDSLFGVINGGFGGKIIEEENDPRSLNLNEVDINDARLVTMLREGEKKITGLERVKRLKAFEWVRPDIRIVQAFLDNEKDFPERWKENINGRYKRIFFDGAIMSRPDSGTDYLSPYIYWKDGKLCIRRKHLHKYRCSNDLSLVFSPS